VTLCGAKVVQSVCREVAWPDARSHCPLFSEAAAALCLLSDGKGSAYLAEPFLHAHTWGPYLQFTSLQAQFGSLKEMGKSVMLRKPQRT
jgi:hypothetical protein